ncbi:MAG TPA: tetratricopeptide repeat protein [Candidatus Sulfopaludibacter sp.]|jgi:tetratricopeptide (TPR) repeat protein|nr:tetratricopeptide repeat protein [Candidatus Sulfopaludibacter sp.]
MWPLAAVLFFVQAADFSSDGMKALEAGKYDAAEQAFQKAIAADPKDYTAHFNLALAYGFEHKDAEGIAEYRKTLELQPKLYEAELNGGILLLRQKKPGEALPLFEDAAAQKPQEFRPRYYLAECQLQTGALAPAEENYRAALGLNPKSAGAELGMAHALARQSKLAEAAPHFRMAAQLDPNYRDSLLELADLYEQNKQPEEALTLYREFPGNAAAQEHAGALLLAANRNTEALAALEESYTKDPTEANRVALAMAYSLNKKFDKAVPLFQQVVAAEPSNFNLLMAYGLALREQKQYPAAAAQFAEAVKQRPSDRDAWRDWATTLYLAKDYPRALAALDKDRQLGEDTAGTAFLRAIMLDEMKQLKPALDAYHHFLELSQGKNSNQEWQARQRVKLIERELEKR